MRWQNLYIAGSGTYFPEGVETAEEAIAAGRYSTAEHAANGIRAVRTAGESEAPPVMAATAGRLAVERSGHAAEDFSLVLHGCMGHQGQDFWTPAHYVQRETVGGHGPAIEIRQGSNGGLAGLELAASQLTARPNATAALITTGDAFQSPYVDRWRTENQQVYGDGGTALVLSNREGFARLRSTSSRSEPELEPVYRGTGGWTPAPDQAAWPVDLRGRTREYLLADPFRYDDVIARTGKSLDLVVRDALADADAALDDVAFVVHPAIGETIVEYSYFGQLGIGRERTAYDWARDFGHLGAGDQFAGIDHLVASGRAARGDLLLAIGVGIGYMWTAAVVEVLDSPGW
ncbi:ketoacyl-ACP synthase III family protein [Streptomyces sp. APSN-46.1]|uniref:ketoacyl-ACP synthase III family protein n=1 Tax=Streptomyces sp. APSN-46.1 TaxID=2929049 RepID=UPI001FB3CDB8|nr:ketoacyl-ACP synthase III family protein [Streptomyces sp. APSN-46.1]MCJ1681154.1 ketoacyl-ACP synthase III family protein [Streptomyces sp. APSN-46.1]